MKIRKLLITVFALGGMTTALLPAIPASAASIPTDGTGTVIENTTADSSSREFFTIKTAEGNVFYVVVDKTKTNDNVYLLTPVTEDSLKALAESAVQKNGTVTASGTPNLFGGQSGSSEATGATGATTTGSGSTAPTNTAKTQKAATAVSVGNIAFIILVAILVFGAAFYFKIYKPKHKAAPDAFNEEPDDYDSDEDSDDEDEVDESGETEKPRKSAPAQKQQVNANKEQSEQGQPDTREPSAPAAPRARREDVWPENRDSMNNPEAEKVQPQPSRPVQAFDGHSSRARVGGLFAPDVPDTKNPPQESATDSMKEPEEPEPGDEEDYADGMDAFGNPDEED